MQIPALFVRFGVLRESKAWDYWNWPKPEGRVQAICPGVSRIAGKIFGLVPGALGLECLLLVPHWKCYRLILHFKCVTYGANECRLRTLS